MATNYTDWPTSADVITRLTNAGITPRSTIDATYYERATAAVVKHLEHKTHRQFKAGSAGEIRYFDGNGSGELDIDEFVAFTSVDVLGYISSSTSISLTQVVSANTETFPKNRLIIFQSSMPTVYNSFINRFPRGRRNIKVTGTWGYSQYINDEVWWAVSGMIAAQIAAETVQGGSGGRIRKWIEGDAMEELDLKLPGEVIGWVDDFKRVINAYRKPFRARNIRLAEMI